VILVFAVGRLVATCVFLVATWVNWPSCVEVMALVGDGAASVARCPPPPGTAEERGAAVE
jgi:hypothetical protein